MIFLAKVAIGTLGVALVGGTVLCEEGFIQVRVHEKQPDGTNVNVVVPAALLPVTLRLVSNRSLAGAVDSVRPYLPVVDAAIPALEDCPNGALIEVTDANEHVLITKRGGSIVVDVTDPEDKVHVSVPLRAAQSSIHALAAARKAN
jgi:hypothetical protein